MQKTSWKLLFTLGGVHFIADAISGFTVTSTAIHYSFLNIALIILSYNVVAFALQPLFGAFVDRLNIHFPAITFGMGVMGIGLVLFSSQPILALTMIAVGSAMIHVGAGALSSLATPKRSIGAALFAAPGVIGLTLGTLAAMQSFPMIPILIIAAIILIAILIIVKNNTHASSITVPMTNHSSQLSIHSILIIGALVLFVAFRSTLWLQQSASSLLPMILAFGVAAGIGKLAGGIFADRFGRAPTIIIATAFALLCFLEGSMIMTVVGIFALQSSTAIILSSAVQRLPRHAGTVAGLILGFGLALAGVIQFIE